MEKKVLEFAKKKLEDQKVDSYEIYYLEKGHFLANSKDKEIDTLEEAMERGVSFRIIYKGRLGFSYSTAMEHESIERAILQAVSSSREIKADDCWTFSKKSDYQKLNWPHKETLHLSVKDKKKFALTLEESALIDSRIKRVKKAVFEEIVISMRVINSEGVDAFFEKNVFACEVMALAESNGDSQSGYDVQFAHLFNKLEPTQVAINSARHALSMLGAKKISTMRLDVALHPFVVASLLKPLIFSFLADNVYKRKSSIASKKEELVYSPMVSIIDNAFLEGGFGSRTFDGEGTASSKVMLVENGVVKNWLADNFWSNKLKCLSTGSCVRDSVKTYPSIGITNSYIEPAQSTREEIFKKMHRGLFITELIGAHTINPITGEFSVGVEGQWIENGEIDHPVKGIAIAGNLHEIFKKIAAVGNDIRFLGKTGAPTLLISDIQLSGK